MTDSDKPVSKAPEAVEEKTRNKKAPSRFMKRKRSVVDSDKPVSKAPKPVKAKAQGKKSNSRVVKRERSMSYLDKLILKTRKTVKAEGTSEKTNSRVVKLEHLAADSDKPVSKAREAVEGEVSDKKKSPSRIKKRKHPAADSDKPVSKAPEAVEGEVADKKKSSPWIVRNLRFIFRNKMYKPMYWLLLCRFLKFKIRHPGIKTEGPVFLPRKYEFKKGKNAEFTIGAWVWIGKGCAIRAHEGSLRIGSKVAMGGGNTINCFEHVEIGDECLMADNIYIADFDHWYIDPEMSIRSQGIRKEPVKIEPDVWIGEKATILRGVTVGSGSIVGAMSLVTRNVPEYAIVGGVPARVLKYRRSPEDVAWDKGEY